MLDLLKHSMNQRLAFALLALMALAVLVWAEKVESGGFVTAFLGLLAAYYGEQAFDRWVAGQEGQKS